MSPQEFKRKLTAILSADVVGYSRLMGEDEAATVKTLEIYKGVMFSLIKQHRGRVVDSPGDNLLAEFGSVVDAVQCAVSIQKELQTHNADLSESRRMEFRIGINLGDVIEEEDRIYGDGVNIAARLEALADPGGICVSKTAFDQIESKLPLGYQFLGEQTVKNIVKPIGAYRVLMHPRVSGTAEEEKERTDIRKLPRRFLAGAIVLLLMVLGFGLGYLYLRLSPTTQGPTLEDRIPSPASDTRSIAVLPFVNVSGDPEQEYFSDGITEELIGTLAKLEGLKVISRTSVFYFKGKDADLQTIGERLNVENVLEGSVRTAGNRVRINVQLIKVADDMHLWSETYDRELQDVFGIQEEISNAIVDKLQVQLLGKQTPELVKPYTANMEARDLYLKGRFFSKRSGPGAPERAIGYFEKAIEADPDNALAYIGFSGAYSMLVSTGAFLPREAYPKQKELIAKALEIDDKLAEAHGASGALKANYEYNWKGAETDFKRALELDPGSSGIHGRYGMYLAAVGRMDEALQEAKHALELDPLSVVARTFLGTILIHVRQFDEALEILSETLEPGRTNPVAMQRMAKAYAEKGLFDKAIALLQRLRQQGRGPISDAPLAYVYARAGRREEAQEMLDALLDRVERGYFAPYAIAEIYSALDEKDKAFEWLAKAYDERDPSQILVRSNPAFDNLHSDMRWRGLQEMMGMAD